MRLSIYGAVNLLSYGLVSTNICQSLTESNQEVQLFPINENNIECEPQYQESIRKGLENARLFNKDVPCIKIWHQWQHSIFPGNSRRIGFPIFELDNLTELEQHNLNSLDGVFVCSHWAKDVCNQFGIKAWVAPLGVDRSIFSPSESVPKNNKTIFLNIGKWEYRKGHIELIEAFNNAFEKNDRVELWMLSDNCFLRPEDAAKWHNLYKSSKLGDKVKFLGRQGTQKDIQYIIGQSHFGVFPSRTEGWGLGTLEMMACGKSNIVTNYGGHTEFCNDKNSLLINFDELEEANDGIWFKPGGPVNQGKWGKFTEAAKEQLVYQFRNAHKMNLENSETLTLMRQQCLKTAEQFSWMNTARSIIAHLSI